MLRLNAQPAAAGALVARARVRPRQSAWAAVHNGQGRGPYGLIFGLELLSLRRIRQEWDSWRDIPEEMNQEPAGSMAAQPDGYVRKLYLPVRQHGRSNILIMRNLARR